MSERRSEFQPVIRDCLVGVVADDADLHRFRDEKWYRIPDRALGRSLGRDALHELRTLAIYQSGGVTDGLPGSIELWGEIAAIETMRRRELLPEERTHPAADELYHRLRIDAVRRLPQPIVSRLPRRVTFLRTTRERLLQAVDLNDLVIVSAAEDRLWREVREAYPEFSRNVFMQVNGVLMEVDFALMLGERSLGVLCRDDDRIAEAQEKGHPEAWRIIRFSPSRVEKELEECVREILRAAEEARRNFEL